ncbi:MAG: MBL fold metallo-hydrolase [Pseudobdellovibrionaceae bacterium]
MSKWFTISILAMVFSLGCSSRNYKGPVSDHFDVEKFSNQGIRNEKSLWTVLKWQLNRDEVPWPESVENKVAYQPTPDPDPNKVYVTFVNHSTFLIQWRGFNILTDPVWAERTSPVSFAGPKRVRPPGIPFEQLPPIDLVVVTHNHYDHLDVETLKNLNQKFSSEFRVALGDGALMKKNGIVKVKEMDWFQSEDFQKGTETLAVTFVPAHHWSGRGLNDRFLSLWGAYVFSSRGKHIFYGGDTGYSSHFLRIKERFSKFELAFLPIGAYEPRWFMKEHHMNPEEAVQAWKDIGGPPTLGMHFGTFPLTDEGLEDPRKDLEIAKQKHGLAADAFIAPDEGKTYQYQIAP